jgi:hypothetical protein
VEISIDLAKIEVIIKWKFKDLYNKSVIRSFLGLYNYVRMFYYYVNGLTEPLNRLFKKDVPFERSQKQEEAFEALKKLTCETSILTFFQPGRLIKVKSNALRNVTGSVIL